MRRPALNNNGFSVQSHAAQGVSRKARPRMWHYPAERDGSCGVRESLRSMPKNAQQAILESLEGNRKYPVHEFGDAGHSPRRLEVEAPTASISTQWGR
jgi:phospholipid/cholesterol/gamma-HCH transport system ATP-binding protein